MTALAFLRSSILEQAHLITDADAFAEQFVSGLDPETLKQVFAEAHLEEQIRRFGRFDSLFPDEGVFRRELYPKHLEFFAAGKAYRERCFMAANRVGKTVAGGYEVAAHLTGQYPHWWEGRVFRRPVRVWVAGDTNETTRDILQLELCGEIAYGSGGRKTVDGSGLIKRDTIGEISWKTGVQNLIDTVQIRHKSGGFSKLSFKSYDQGRRVFQGTAKEIIWLDEEAPQDVYGECLVRTATTRGVVLTTFTPLLGISEVVQSFLPKGYVPGEM